MTKILNSSIALAVTVLTVNSYSQNLDELFDLPLEELINIEVSVNRFDELSQNVAVSVTALSGEQIQEWQISDLTELGEFVPGLFVGGSGYDPRPAMRGARSQQVEFNDTTVSLYQDGIYRPRHAMGKQPYVDLERVEAMRGPQGTLYGRNSFGGTVHAVSRAPELDLIDTKITVETGNYNRRKQELISNIPLGEKVAFRFAASSIEHDPYVENIIDPDAGLKDQDTTYLRGRLLYQINEHNKILLSADQWKEDANGNGDYGYKVEGIPLNLETNLTSPDYALIPRIGTDDMCGFECGSYGAGMDIRATAGFDDAEAVPDGPYRVANDFNPTQTIDSETFTFQYDTQLSSINAKFLYGRGNFKDYRLTDGDFSRYSTSASGYSVETQDESAELQFSSTSENLRWVAGLFYQQEDMEYAFLWKDFVVFEDLIDNRPDPNTTPIDHWASWMSNIEFKNLSKGLYGQLTYSLTSNLRAVAGLRVNQDEKKWEEYRQDPNDLTVLNFVVPVTTGAGDEWMSTTWKAGLEFDYSPRDLMYTNVSTGFLSGNYKSQSESYDEQNVTQIEFGYKGTKLNNLLYINTSIYYNLYSDLLSTEFTDRDGVTFGEVDNAGSIEAYGVETEIDWRYSENWLFGFIAHLSQIEYDDFITGNSFHIGGETVNGIDNLFNLKGEQVMMSPDYSLTMLAQNTLSFNRWGKVQTSLMVSTNGSYRTIDELYKYAENDAYTQTDLHVNWYSPGGTFNIYGFAENLTEEEIQIRGNRYSGNIAVTDYADPRTFGVGLRILFQ